MNTIAAAIKDAAGKADAGIDRRRYGAPWEGRQRRHCIYQAGPGKESGQSVPGVYLRRSTAVRSQAHNGCSTVNARREARRGELLPARNTARPARPNATIKLQFRVTPADEFFQHCKTPHVAALHRRYYLTLIFGSAGGEFHPWRASRSFGFS